MWQKRFDHFTKCLADDAAFSVAGIKHLGCALQVSLGRNDPGDTNDEVPECTVPWAC
jgi:hypothetical protein